MNSEESESISQVLNAFHNYSKYTQYTLIEPKKKRYNALSLEEKGLLPWFQEYIQQLEDATTMNQRFFNDMISQIATIWGVDLSKFESMNTNMKDYEKVKNCLILCCKEWSIEGMEERNNLLERILTQLKDDYPEKNSRFEKLILIPGCRLGRLNFELLKQGFQVQGNNWDYFSILLSTFISQIPINKYTIYPFIHNKSSISRIDQLQSISLPDIDQFQILTDLQKNLGESVDVMDLMSITTGSFIDLYGPNDIYQTSSYYTKENKEFRDENNQKFDYIITTESFNSHNYIEYLKTIRHCLQKNGKWINFGSSQCHVINSFQTIQLKDEFGIETSVYTDGLELCTDDVITLTENWFDFILFQTDFISKKYSDIYSNDDELVYWIATKKLP